MEQYTNVFLLVRKAIAPSGSSQIMSLYTDEQAGLDDIQTRNQSDPASSGLYALVELKGQFDEAVDLSRPIDLDLNCDRKSALFTVLLGNQTLEFEKGLVTANSFAEWHIKAPNPPGASGFNLSIAWVPDSTETGYVRYRVSAEKYKEATHLNSLPIDIEFYNTPDQSYTGRNVVKTTLVFPHKINGPFKLRLQRMDGVDTLDTDIFVVGASVRYF